MSDVTTNAPAKPGVITPEENKKSEMELAGKNESAINRAAREIAARLKFLIVGGNKLQDHEVWALAQYSAATELNPFAQECYYIPGSGPITGIVGYRRKAHESFAAEIESRGIKEQHTWWVETRPALPGEAVFDPAKDIAIVAILRDTLSSRIWRQAFFETCRELKALGLSDKEYFIRAEAMVGKEPTWEGIGVVQSPENFSKDGKPEKFDRVERAKKRAEKQALKKRFPSLQAYATTGDPDDYIDSEAIQWRGDDEETPKQISPERMAENDKIFGIKREPKEGAAPAVEHQPVVQKSILDPLPATEEIMLAAMNTYGPDFRQLGEYSDAELSALVDNPESDPAHKEKAMTILSDRLAQIKASQQK